MGLGEAKSGWHERGGVGRERIKMGVGVDGRRGGGLSTEGKVMVVGRGWRA